MAELSNHAMERAAQWNISNDEVEFAVKYGHRVRRAGVIFCQVRKNHMPRDLAVNDPLHRLTGTTVVLCPCACYVVTLYRNERAFKKDRRKQKFNRNKNAPFSCPCCGRASA